MSRIRCGDRLRLGVNMDGSRKPSRRRGSKWASLDFLKDSSLKRVINERRSQGVLSSSLGLGDREDVMESGVPSSFGSVRGSEEVSSRPSSVGEREEDSRTADERLTKLVQRKKLAGLYGGRVRRNRARVNRLIPLALSDANVSMLSEVERRLSVVLWRARLVPSVSSGVDWVLRGWVSVEKDGDGRDHPYPGRLRSAGSVVRIRPEVWGNHKHRLISDWSLASNEFSIPSYLYVCLESGSLVFLRVPRDGEVLFPRSMTFSVRSLSS